MTAIVNALNKNGISAHKTVKTAGLYYDGTQHGEIIPCVRICADKSVAIFPAIKKILRYYPGYIAVPISHPHYSYYDIITEEDAKRAEAAQKEADIFLTAFWWCIHNQPGARDNNAALAIAAGHDALRREAATL